MDCPPFCIENHEETSLQQIIIGSSMIYLHLSLRSHSEGRLLAPRRGSPACDGSVDGLRRPLFLLQRRVEGEGAVLRPLELYRVRARIETMC